MYKNTTSAQLNSHLFIFYLDVLFIIHFSINLLPELPERLYFVLLTLELRKKVLHAVKPTIHLSASVENGISFLIFLFYLYSFTQGFFHLSEKFEIAGQEYWAQLLNTNTQIFSNWQVRAKELASSFIRI